MSKVVITPRDVENLIPDLKIVGIDDKVVAYKFTGGQYEGVVYTYAKIKFNVVDTTTGSLVDMDPSQVTQCDTSVSLAISFEYVIFENPLSKVVDTKEFMEFIGNILTTVIDNSVS